MKARGVLIAGNWKMNHTVAETEQFFSALKDLSKASLPAPAVDALKVGKLQACVIPPMLSLPRAAELASRNPFSISVSAQNVHWEKKGAFTGEVSGPMLQE